MNISTFYGTRCRNLQAVIPSYADDSDDGLNSDNDIDDPDYALLLNE